MVRNLITAFSLLTATSAFALEPLDEFEDTVCCVEAQYCAPLSQYQWRPAGNSIELMEFKDLWCRVTVLNAPLRRTFNGQPVDACASLICFVPPKR